MKRQRPNGTKANPAPPTIKALSARYTEVVKLRQEISRTQSSNRTAPGTNRPAPK